MSLFTRNSISLPIPKYQLQSILARHLSQTLSQSAHQPYTYSQILMPSRTQLVTHNLQPLPNPLQPIPILLFLASLGILLILLLKSPPPYSHIINSPLPRPNLSPLFLRPLQQHFLTCTRVDRICPTHTLFLGTRCGEHIRCAGGRVEVRPAR